MSPTTFLVDYFSRQDDIELAMLFGSYATALERTDSDLDIAVLGRGPLRAPLSVERCMSLIAELGALTGRAVDLIDLADAGIPILGSVVTTGRTLLARNPDAATDLLVRYLIDAADFLPYYERTLSERRAAWIGSE